jgi:S-adenosylmethionine synthetase
VKLRLFTSESVTEGHPDKVADQISDQVLDHILAEDPHARVACETLVTTGLALVSGEITTETYVEIPDIVRETIRQIGYTRSEYGIDGSTCAVLSSIDRQADEIRMGVDAGGAGDQGMMFGYATDETEELMPLPIVLAHRLTRALASARHEGRLPWLRPDGKAQVTVAYDGDRPVRVETVVVAAQHDPEISREALEEGLMTAVIDPVLPEEFHERGRTQLHLNPTGSFVVGGPHGDTGLTGRKIIVDTYGGVGRHGGGAFSGKDATKVDRSAAYAARWAAKNVVAAGIARRCEIQLAYAIGVADPVSVWVDTFGTSDFNDEAVADAVSRVFDFRPRGIIDALGLRDPIYGPAAAYGHFGRTPERVERFGRAVQLFPWERTDRVDALRDALGI